MRVLLIRTSAFGDIIHCMPALRVLREEMPDAHIGWLAEDVFAPLLANDPDVDELLTVKLRGWRHSLTHPSTWREAGQAFSAIHRFNADVVLDLMGNHKAGALAALTGSERRIGLRYADRRESSSAMWLSESVPTRGRHAVDRALAVVAGLGLPSHFRGFGADQLALAAAGQRPEAGDYVVIHPGTAWANKCYPAESWGAVARRLSASCSVVLSIGPGEEALATAIEAASDGTARRADAVGIPSLVGLMAGARLVLGGDTGPTHLAHALNVPTLFLHGPTDPATHGPYGAPDRALWTQLPCSFCHKRYGSTQRCLLELDPTTVANKALALLYER